MRSLADKIIAEANMSLGLPRIDDAYGEAFVRSRGFDCAICEYAGYQWAGAKLCADDGSGLVHEFAHFVVAENDRKLLPDFGLGSGPDFFNRAAELLVSADHARFEEAEASMLGILIERALGFNFGVTLKHHSWTGELRGDPLTWLVSHADSKLTLDVLSSLVERKLIDDTGDVLLHNLPPIDIQ